MHKTGAPLMMALSVVAILAGCSSRPFLMHGDARSAEVSYSGDIENAMPIARQHCAQYERVPRLAASNMGTAYFDCVPR